MLIVQKFGGTSVADTEKIKMAAKKIAGYREKGHRIVVVISALARETDRLIEMADQIDENAVSDRERDVILSSGEQVSAGLLALALKAQGIDALSLLSFQIPIVTDGIYGRSRIDTISTDTIAEHLEKGKVVVIPGFQGISRTCEITTLGRGGSDTSAVALAAAIEADICEIYSDVDGVYTADPNLVENAKKINKVTYEEMLEIAGAGAKIVQMRAVELAAKYGLPLHIRSSFTKTSGTIIEHQVNEGEMEKIVVSAITHTLNEAKIAIRKIRDHTGLAAEIFEPLSRSNINVDMIVQNIGEDEKTDIAFTVDKNDLKKALAVTERAAARIEAGRVEAAGDVSKISIIGVGMRSHAGVAAKIFETLKNEGIDIHLISTSEIKVSTVVDMKHTEKAVKALHRSFRLDE